jgi:hypothetical protein
MLLGIPFLAATNPDIDWTKGAFKGTIVAAADNAHKWTPHSQSKIREAVLDIPPGYRHYETQLPRYLNVRPEDYIFSPQWVYAQKAERDLWEDYVSGDYITIQRTSHTTELAASQAKPKERHWTQIIPPEYHQYRGVFSEASPYARPPKCPWDHEIELTPDAPAVLNCKVYPLLLGQQKHLDEFIKEHLRRGFIRVSNSPYASPIFFVKKKDGRLRPVQDYRQLNKYTVRNTYPLPLIKELIPSCKQAMVHQVRRTMRIQQHTH